MLDFLVIATRSGKRGIIEIYPKFIIKKSSDLMIRGGDFYAIWIEERGLWSTDEQDAVDLIDRELDRYAEENCKRFDDNYRVMHMWDAETGMIDTWHKYCQKQMKDQFHMLDEKLIFSNSKTGKKDYASKMLNYPLEQGEANSYDKLMSVLYSPAERHKIEWAIGSVVSGDSKRLQKFMVLYGAAGTGKSTVLNIIQQLFDGYYSVFDANVIDASPLRGGHPACQIGQVYGIVEFKDGVRRVDPVSIKFCDEENASLCALVKHNEALRKGEVNAES